MNQSRKLLSEALQRYSKADSEAKMALAVLALHTGLEAAMQAYLESPRFENVELRNKTRNVIRISFPDLVNLIRDYTDLFEGDPKLPSLLVSLNTTRAKIAHPPRPEYKLTPTQIYRAAERFSELVRRFWPKLFGEASSFPLRRTTRLAGRYRAQFIEDEKEEKEAKAPAEAIPIQPSRPSLGPGNRWAVLVGVDQYEDSVNYPPLRVCVKDVEAIYEQLIAGGFDPARIRLLTDHANEPPTRAKILTALQSVANATEYDDLLLFYYSGHGYEARGESYLVARDGHFLTLSDTAVSVSRVKEIMDQAPARAKVIVLDACHSGADIGGKGPKPMSPEFIRRVFEEAEGMAILASCKQGQLSYEWRTQERSVFTRFLLEALAGEADQDEKGFITVQDASRHVTNGVKLWASQNNTSQTPTLQYTVAGDIILVSC